MIKKDEGHDIKGALLAAIIIILVLVIGWHVLFPMLGIAVAITATAWALVVATVTVFSLAVLLFFLLPGIIIFIVCVLGFVWLLVSLVLFPFLFPFLVPLFILLLFTAYIRRRNK